MMSAFLPIPLTMPLTDLHLPANAQVQVLADIHLHASDDATFTAWQGAMLGSHADAIILLGDIFEVWVGDDWGLQDPFALQCAAVLRHGRQRQMQGLLRRSSKEGIAFYSHDVANFHKLPFHPNKPYSA